MSLELKIERLTVALDILNENMLKLLNVQVEEKPISTPNPTPKAEPKPEPVVEQGLTHKDIQDFLLGFVREDMTRKPKIKALLAKYSAGKVSDIEAAKLVEFKAQLGKL